MNAAELQVWRRTSPFAILFFLGRILRLIVKNAFQALAPLFAFLVAYQGDLASKLILAAIGLASFVVIAALLSYWFFRYRIGDNSIQIREGVIKKTQLEIKFDRIQGINTEQNPIYRLLGLVTVSFDTAGSAGTEGNLPAVTRTFADSLRERIGKPRALEADGDEEPVDADATALLRLGWRDMVRIGLADRRALLLVAFIAPLLDQMDVKFERYLNSVIQFITANGIELDTVGGLSIGISIAIFVVLLLVIFSIAAAFLRFHNFELFLQGRTLYSNGGLLTRHQHSMELGKIQTLRLEQGVLQRLMKRYRLTARQATSSGKNRNKKVFDIPLLTAEIADTLRQRFLAPEAGRLTQNPRSEEFKAVSRAYMRSRIFFVGLLPALLASAIFWRAMGATGLLVLLWVPLTIAAAYRSWSCAGYLHDNDEIIRRSGFLGYRTVGLLFRKVQRVTVSQSRYQRRKGLASLHMFMASGSVKVPYISHAEAKQLRDYILYKVESSERAWH